MSPEDISKNFGESHHCKNLKLENLGKCHQASETGESRTQLDELQGSR